MNANLIEPHRTPDGFRYRGEQVTRLEAFVDAAFAFALTLLVISLDHIPQDINELINALKGVPAFALSFVQIGMFWYAHVRWSRRYGLDDTTSILLSLALVFLILVYVYPLKILFGSLFSWITDGWIPWTMQINSYTDITHMFIIYGIAFASLSLCMAALYINAWRRRGALQLDAEESAATAGDIALWLWGACVAMLSIAAALLVPKQPAYWLSGMPGFVYFLMNLSGLIVRQVAARVRARPSAATRVPE